jgi:hypothetical protein
MKPVEVTEQYKMTHSDGDVPPLESETKDGVDIQDDSLRAAGFKGDKRCCRDPEFVIGI